MIEDRRTLLEILELHPSPQSVDYVRNKSQFQLHRLVTEQRHPNTWNLSFILKDDIRAGLDRLFSVDEDVTRLFERLSADPSALNRAAGSVAAALRRGSKIFIYGCGATGRLAKQMESALWRPFWKRIKHGPLWPALAPHLPEDVEDRLIGEMTGGDRALISSLEGLEDLPLVGRLQLQDRGIRRGDAVFGITEGGETSSVIGAVLAAAEFYGGGHPEDTAEARDHLFFLYNNPDVALKPLARSRTVLDHPSITKINLATGPQAITGSTRMQATTSETFVMGSILEQGILDFLKDHVSEDSLLEMGFFPGRDPKARLSTFRGLQKTAASLSGEAARFTLLESETYARGGKAAYFAGRALVAVFTDCTERSPTFHIHPLDTVSTGEPRCWFQVRTAGETAEEAWQNFLGRRFRGLDRDFFGPSFERSIHDPFLRSAALKSLAQAGSEQERLYDFSLAAGRKLRRGDLGVLVCFDEEIDRLSDPDSAESRFAAAVKEAGSALVCIFIGDRNPPEVENLLDRQAFDPETDILLTFRMSKSGDPLDLNRQILLKLLLNAHSTAVFGLLGRVVGNTMTNVKPSNLKLIGRATFLIWNHVNDVLRQTTWAERYGRTAPLSYAEANAVLFEAMAFTANRQDDAAEVDLSIILILEVLRRKSKVDWDEVLKMNRDQGLESYLRSLNPHLKEMPSDGRGELKPGD